MQATLSSLFLEKCFFRTFLPTVCRITIIAGFSNLIAGDWALLLDAEGDSPNGSPAGIAIAIDRTGTFLSLPEALASDEGPWHIQLNSGEKVQLEEITHKKPFITFSVTKTTTPWHLSYTDVAVGSPITSLSNNGNSAAVTGQLAQSTGIVSGHAVLPADLPPVPGRRGQVSSTYRGKLWEISTAITYGSSGGPVLNDKGAVVGLSTLAQAPERRIGGAIPLLLMQKNSATVKEVAAEHNGTASSPQQQVLAQLSASLGLFHLQRPQGLGNPPALPRPQPINDDLPAYQQESAERAWERYLHQQQILWRDQPCPVVATGPHHFWTAAEHLHGEAQAGLLLGAGPDGQHLPAELETIVNGVAIFRSAQPHGMQPIQDWGVIPNRGELVQVLAPGRYLEGVSIAAGIRSSNIRTIDENTWLQMDVRLNYGNLGGLVVNADGAPVGVAVGIGPHRHWLTGAGVSFVASGQTVINTIAQTLEPHAQEQETEQAQDDQMQATAAIPRHGLAAGVSIDQGSGVIISPEGLVLSNHHVTGDRLRHTIELEDGRQFKAFRLGTDPVGDLSLFQIENPPDDLPSTTLASTAARAGDPVWAVGNPFALAEFEGGLTWSQGHVSQPNMTFGTYWHCYMADVPVNPGNSGGGLLNEHGELLGINGLISSRTGFRINSGLAFAIHSALIEQWLPVLAQAQGGYCRHRQEPEWELTTTHEGHLEIVSDTGPFQAGDRLRMIDGQRPFSQAHVTALVQAAPWTPENSAIFVVLRQGTEETIAIHLEPLPIPGKASLGIIFDRSKKEAVIASVPADSLAAQAGLQAGQTIVTMNDQPIKRRLDMLRAMRQVAIGETVTLVTASNETLSVPVIAAGPTGPGL
jgi:S1-C subfamily serine protease